MKVTDREPSGARRVYTLTPWAEPHPKGGEAYHVDSEGVRIGDVRRWECSEVSVRVSGNSGRIGRRQVVYWTVYPTGKGAHTLDSRAGALRWLRSP